MYADPSIVAAPASTGAAVLRGHITNGNFATGVEQWVSLDPDTQYVLSAYLWNFGDASNFVNANVDLTDVFNEVNLWLSSSSTHPGAEGGYFMYGTFNTRDTGTSLLVRAFYDAFTGTGSADPVVGAQWERTMGYWTELCQTQIAQARDWMSEAAQVATAGSNASMRQVQSGGKQERKAA